MTIPGAQRDRFRTEELLAAVEAYQRMLIRSAVTPDPGRMWVRTAQRALRIVGAALLGIVTAAFAIVLSFLVFNVLFHI